MKKVDKPIIGITPLFDLKRDSIWMLPDYMNAIESSGGIPIILPLTSDDNIIFKLAHSIDGLLITGGQDVNPSLYKETKKTYCGQICDARDNFEMKMLDEFVKLDKPILAICRGFQLLNVYFGGTLYQDLKEEYPSKLNHRMTGPNNQPEHSVSIKKDTILHSILGENVDVNSCHHQGIKKLGDSLISNAISDDGLIEGIERPSSKFVLAVQWHPERLFLVLKEEMKIFKRFVLETKKGNTND